MCSSDLADSAALVATQVHQHSPIEVGDQPHGRGELWAAVAPPRTEHIPREAFAVQSDGDGASIDDVAAHQRQVLLTGRVGEGMARERPPFGGSGAIATN